MITDIHMHVIPGVDDGARNISESLMMLRIASNQGVTNVIATSHSDAFDRGHSSVVFEQFCDLKKAVEQKGIPISLYFGAEIYCWKPGIDETVKMLGKGIYPTLNGTRYVLAEFYPGESQTNALYCLRKLKENGFYPVLAHAERCDFVDEEFASTLRESGVLIQINLYSVEQEHDDTIRNRANMLLHNRFVDFVGSDAHRMDHRSPQYRIGTDYLYANYEREYVDAILSGNAAAHLI